MGRYISVLSISILALAFQIGVPTEAAIDTRSSKVTAANELDLYYQQLYRT